MIRREYKGFYIDKGHDYAYQDSYTIHCVEDSKEKTLFYKPVRIKQRFGYLYGAKNFIDGWLDKNHSKEYFDQYTFEEA